MSNSQFGFKLKELRLAQNMTLREFATLAAYDASNLSKIERGLLPPPARQILKVWAKYLKLVPGSPEYHEFLDGAELSAYRLPRNTPAPIINMLLPALLRTFRSEKLTKQDYERLVRLLNK